MILSAFWLFIAWMESTTFLGSGYLSLSSPLDTKPASESLSTLFERFQKTISKSLTMASASAAPISRASGGGEMFRQRQKEKVSSGRRGGFCRRGAEEVARSAREGRGSA